MTDRIRTYDFMGQTLHFHAFTDEMGGRACMFEATVPAGAGAPPHHHAGEAEVFLVLDGTLTFRMGDEIRVARSGDCLSIPDGAVHAFENRSDSTARVLVFNAPGHAHEQFFLAAATPSGAPAPAPLDMTALLMEAEAAGITILAA